MTTLLAYRQLDRAATESQVHSSQVQADSTRQRTNQQDVLVLSRILESVDHVHTCVNVDFAGDHIVVEAIHFESAHRRPLTSIHPTRHGDEVLDHLEQPD